MSLLNIFNKANQDYDAAAEFFITPEIHIKESNTGEYSLAIDTGYEDLKRTVKRLNLKGSEISIKTKTLYVDFKELYSALDISNTTLNKSNYPKPPIGALDDRSVLVKKDPSPIKPDKGNKKAKEYKSEINLPIDALLAEHLPEAIRLKQDHVVEKGVYYKPLQVISTLVVQNGSNTSEQEIATSYYLSPVSYIDGVYSPLSAVQASHIVETSWSDAYIEAMNGDDGHEAQGGSPKANRKIKATNPFIKAPLIVALSLSAAFASLYGFNQYQQNNNPLTLAASDGNVGTYMNAKGSNTDEYTQRQLEATKAALSSMGIDVSADADIGCLIE